MVFRQTCRPSDVIMLSTPDFSNKLMSVINVMITLLKFSYISWWWINTHDSMLFLRVITYARPLPQHAVHTTLFICTRKHLRIAETNPLWKIQPTNRTLDAHANNHIYSRDSRMRIFYGRACARASLNIPRVHLNRGKTRRQALIIKPTICRRATVPRVIQK